jgi:hypothetical protein
MIAWVLGVVEAGHVRTTVRLGFFRTRCGGWALLRVTDSRSGCAAGRSDTALLKMRIAGSRVRGDGDLVRRARIADE